MTPGPSTGKLGKLQEAAAKSMAQQENVRRSVVNVGSRLGRRQLAGLALQAKAEAAARRLVVQAPGPAGATEQEIEEGGVWWPIEADETLEYLFSV